MLARVQKGYWYVIGPIPDRWRPRMSPLPIWLQNESSHAIVA